MTNTENKKTAILVFARSANEEVNHKSIYRGETLFDVLTQNTLAKVKRSNLPYFHYTEEQQIGTSFGERFTNAIQAIYNLGYENVITVGNDSPQLKTTHLLKAHEQLTAGKTVLGPTIDGGFYLMGLNRQNFDKALFLRLPWQRFGLLNRISQLFDTVSSDLYRLSVLHDIDTDADVSFLAGFKRSIATKVLRILIMLSSVFVSVIPKNFRIQKEYFTSLFYNKGSPVYPLT